MILLKMAGALSFPAEHDEDFSVRYKKWCPSCRAIDQNVTPRKTLFSQGDILIYRTPWRAPFLYYCALPGNFLGITAGALGDLHCIIRSVPV
jgi:hypothetical protein